MPISAKDCSVDELDQAVRAYEERMSQTLLTAREQIQALGTQAANLDKALLAPLTATLDKMLAVTGLTSDELIASMGFITGGTPSAMEKEVTRAGLSIVNGRALVTRSGDVDLTSLRVLHSLLGSMEAIKKLVPEITPCYLTSDPTATAPFKSKFLFIATAQKTKIVPSLGCKAETVVVTEEVVGVETAISQILYKRPDLSRGDLTFYVFWIGKPDARQSLRDRALFLGFTEEEYFDILLKVSSEGLHVYALESPAKQICHLSAFLGADADATLTNIGEGVNSLKLYPSPTEIVAEIEASGVFQYNPGKANASGYPDLALLPLVTAGCLDGEKTFGSASKKSDCLEASKQIDFMDAFFEAQRTAGEYVRTLMNEIVSKAFGFLNGLTAKMSLANSILNDKTALNTLLRCIFPNGIGLTIPLSSQYFTDLINLLQGSHDLVIGFFEGLDALLNIFAGMTCIRLSLASLIPSSIESAIPGVSCLLNPFTFDFCFKVAIDIGAIEASLALQAINAALGAVGNLITALTSLVLNLPGQGQGNGKGYNCLPPEAAVLTQVLAVRSAASRAGVAF